MITCGKENYTMLYKGICKATFKKRRLTFQPTNTLPDFLQNTGSFKQSSLTQKYQNKSKGDAIPTTLFPEDITYAQTRN